jgi:hypothetical protein
MADPEFWSNLADKFNSLHDHVPEAFQWAEWAVPEIDAANAWILADNYAFRMEFTILALRAARMLEPNAAKPVAAWLDALKRHNPPSLEVVDKSRDIGVLPSEGKEIRWIAGELHNLCTASAEYCKALELGAILQAKARADLETQNEPIPTLVEPIESIAEQLRRLRLESRLTVEALTEALGGIDQRNVERHLSGETVPRIGNIGAYERVFSNVLKRNIVIARMPVKRR